MYGLTPYFLTKIAIEIPVLLISPLLMLAIVYWGIGLNDPQEKFFRYYLILELLAQVAAGLGYIMSSSFSNADTALVAAPLIMLPTMMFGGLFVNTSTVPVFIRWIKWVSCVFYAFQAIVGLEF